MGKRGVGPGGAVLAGALVIACGGSTTSDSKPTQSLDYTLHTTVVDECTAVVAGVTFSVEGHPEIPPVTSDASGVADLPLPENAELVVRMVKSGFETKRRYIATTPPAPRGLGLFVFQRTDWYQQVAAELQSTQPLDLSKAMLSMQSVTDIDTKFSFSPVPPDALGALYACVQGTCMVPCNQADSPLGAEAWVEMPAGKYQVRFDAVAGGTCTAPGFKCPGDPSPGCMEVELVPGTLTHVQMPCK